MWEWQYLAIGIARTLQPVNPHFFLLGTAAGPGFASEHAADGGCSASSGLRPSSQTYCRCRARTSSAIAQYSRRYTPTSRAVRRRLRRSTSSRVSASAVASISGDGGPLGELGFRAAVAAASASTLGTGAVASGLVVAAGR